MPASFKSRAVVLLSGGMDSAVCASIAARDHDAAAVHVSYGQRTEQRERQSSIAICRRLQIHDRLMIRNEALRAVGGSALTDSSIPVPAAEMLGRDVPVTYVPFRNAHFLAVAVSWAEVLGAHRVYIGAVEPDKMIAAAEKAFGGWTKGDVAVPSFPAPPALTGRHVYFVQRANSGSAILTPG